MGYIDGDNFIDGAVLSFQEMNRIKNNWRASAAPANIQPGMLFSDADDDRLYHRGAASAQELYQHVVSRTTLPQFANTDFKAINAVCLNDSPVCLNNEMVFLPSW
jgi:hypothetical protein